MSGNTLGARRRRGSGVTSGKVFVSLSFQPLDL